MYLYPARIAGVANWSRTYLNSSPCGGTYSGTPLGACMVIFTLSPEVSEGNC